MGSLQYSVLHHRLLCLCRVKPNLSCIKYNVLKYFSIWHYVKYKLQSTPMYISDIPSKCLSNGSSSWIMKKENLPCMGHQLDVSRSNSKWASCLVTLMHKSRTSYLTELQSSTVLNQIKVKLIKASSSFIFVDIMKYCHVEIESSAMFTQSSTYSQFTIMKMNINIWKNLWL